METQNKRILIVDDERAFLRGISAWLTTQTGLTVTTATNGAEAVESLHSSNIDLVVTDLQMPIMDGFALLAHMSRNYPNIPVMVMTAHGSPAAFERSKELGTLTCLEKPLDMDAFIARVNDTLAKRARGFLCGISITSILQLLEMELKTATLDILSGSQKGSMFFSEGRLIDAETDDLRGDEAAIRIIGWDEPNITIETAHRSPAKTVTSGLQYLMMEAYRRKDEGIRATDPGKKRSSSWEIEPSQSPVPKPRVTPVPLPVPTAKQKKEIEESIRNLCGQDGCSAVVVLKPTGDILASHSAEKQPHSEKRAAALNKVAQAAHEVAQQVGLEGCSEITMGTRKNLVLVQGPEVDGKVPFRVVAFLKWDCNLNMLAQKIGDVIPEILKSFSV